MIISPNNKFGKISVIFLFTFLFFSQFSAAQCTLLTPSGNSFRPNCSGGSDGIVRITNIGSTPADNTTQYFVRRLTAAGDIDPSNPTPIPVPIGQNFLDIAGFTAGSYHFDVIKQGCDNTSSNDVTVTITNPATVPGGYTGQQFVDLVQTTTCADTFVYQTFVTAPLVTTTYTAVYTNNVGATLTQTLQTIQTVGGGSNSALIFGTINIPGTFFNNTSITLVISSPCQNWATITVPFPGNPATDFRINKWTHLNNLTGDYGFNPVALGCARGYQLRRDKWLMSNPISVQIRETDNPSAIPLDFLNQPINDRNYNLANKTGINTAQGPTATLIPAIPAPGITGLKYGTNYTITYTDACGKVFTETVNISDPTPSIVGFSCNTTNNANAAAFMDDLIHVRFQSSSGNFSFLNNPRIRVLSGPATYTTQSGSSPSQTYNITYPYTADADFLTNGYGFFSVPPGNYTFRIEDDCNYSQDITFGATCPTASTTNSFTLNYCAATTPGNANLRINLTGIPVANSNYIFFWRLFNAANAVVAVGNAQTLLNNPINNLPPGTYTLRYGAVRNGSIYNPPFIASSTPLVRYFGNFNYEYEIVIAPSNFSISTVVACANSAVMNVTGGSTPYQFSLLDASGTNIVQPQQSSNTFTGLLVGTTYTAKVRDACGLEASRVFTVTQPAAPTIGTVTQVACPTPVTSSIQLTGLPVDVTAPINNYTITATPGGATFSANTASYLVTGLPPGSYTFTVTVDGCASNPSTSAIINPNPICPIARDDVRGYVVGLETIVNVISNDTSDSAINPASVSIVGGVDSNGDGFNDSLVVSGEGTWTVNPATGQITFTPLGTFRGSPTLISYTVRDVDGDLSNVATVSFTVIGTTHTTICSVDAITYTVQVTVTIGVAPYTATGTPGTWVANVWTSNPIPNGTPYSVTISDSNLPINNSTLISDVSPSCCAFDITCPTFPVTSIQCYNDLPVQTSYTEAEYETLGNGDGIIGNFPCGVIEITASNATGPTCEGDVIRTYTVTEYADPNNNDIRDVGENTVLNTQNCSQIFTIERVAPTFVEALPTNVRVECNTIPTAAVLTATDNCGPATVTYNEVRTNGLCSNSYTLTRTWTATDTCGVTNVHTQTITVEDTTVPTFVEALPADVTVQCNAVPTAAVLTAIDNCGTASVTYNEVRTNGTCSNSYILTRTWTATDACGLTTVHTQTITVEDTMAPTFVEALPADVTVQCNAVPTAAVLTAIDNCGTANVTYNEVRTNETCSNIYTLTRTWTATDACGLITVHTQTITVQDNTPPVFVESLPARITIDCNELLVGAAALLTATDNCGLAAVVYTDIITSGNCANNYTLLRTWTATDACGLTAIQTQTITVQDNTPPNFVEPLPTNVTVDCNTVPTAAVLTATDNCGTATVTYNEIRTDGTCINSYILNRTWTATDTCGLTRVHTQTISVQDTIAPIFVEALPSDITIECNSVPTAVVLTATDNCGTATVTYNEVTTPDSFSNNYTLIRTWTATDQCGNSTTHSQRVNFACHVKIWNAVSPNGDGKNDIFFLEGIDCYPNNTVEIFNRWGVRVFEATGYDNISKVFTGYSDGRSTVSRNELLPTGVYFYILKYEYSNDKQTGIQNIEKSGNLYILNK